MFTKIKNLFTNSKAKAKMATCKHDIKILARRLGRKEAYIDRYCWLCNKKISKEKLSYAPKYYLFSLRKEGFLTAEELKNALEDKWIKGIMSYNIHIDG